MISGGTEREARAARELVGRLARQRRELERARVVVRRHLGEIRRAVRGERGDPVAREPVHVGTARPRDLAVRDVADQDVREGVLLLVGHGRPRLRVNEALLRELAEPCLDVLPREACDVRERPDPERLADDGGVLKHGLPVRRERVEARRDQRLERVGQRQLPFGRALDQHPRVLLGVQRVARGVREQARPDVASHRRLLEQRAQQRDRLLGRQRLERPHGTPLRPALEQLGTRRADDRERDVRAPRGEVLDEIEHAVVRPVQVFEREHEQAAVPRHARHVAAPRGERLTLVARLAAEPDERPQVPLHPFGVAQVADGGRHRRLQALGGDVARSPSRGSPPAP